MIVPASTYIFLAKWMREFKRLGMPSDFIEKYYRSQIHRHYHTFQHVSEIVHMIKKREANMKDDKIMILLLVALYHDVVYNPKSSTNEEDSILIFKSHFSDSLDIYSEVIQIILDTKTHKPTTKLSEIFCRMDLDILYRPFSELITYEDQIFKEFQFYDWLTYQKGRIDVLEKLQESIDIDLESLIEYVRSRKPKIAIYPGSFNPFHQGHLNILQKAERIFDKVIIGYGINPEKGSLMDNGMMDYNYPDVPQALQYNQIIRYPNMLNELVDSLGYPVTVIRGLRNTTDLQYELNQYRFFQELSGDRMNIISIFCDSQYEHISSSAIRQLTKYGKQHKYILT